MALRDIPLGFDYVFSATSTSTAAPWQPVKALIILQLQLFASSTKQAKNAYKL